MTEKILDLINQNPWLNVVFLLLTLCSIFFSFWFYFKSKKSKKPTYALRNFNLVKEKINKVDSVEIQYHSNRIENLSITKLAIWNSGRDTISSNDIAQNDPFLINIKDDFTILECDILFEKNKANGFSLDKRDANNIEINFDYFDFNEGIIIQLYHTATEEDKITVKGSFKGVKNIDRNSSSSNILPNTFYKILKNDSVKPKLMKRIMGVFMFLVPLGLMISVFLSQKLEKTPEPTLFEKIISVSFVTLPYWWLSYRMLRKRVPKGFEIFEDEF